MSERSKSRFAVYQFLVRLRGFTPTIWRQLAQSKRSDDDWEPLMRVSLTDDAWRQFWEFAPVDDDERDRMMTSAWQEGGLALPARGGQHRAEPDYGGRTGRIGTGSRPTRSVGRTLAPPRDLPSLAVPSAARHGPRWRRCGAEHGNRRPACGTRLTKGCHPCKNRITCSRYISSMLNCAESKGRSGVESRCQSVVKGS